MQPRTIEHISMQDIINMDAREFAGTLSNSERTEYVQKKGRGKAIARGKKGRGISHDMSIVEDRIDMVLSLRAGDYQLARRQFIHLKRKLGY